MVGVLIIDGWCVYNFLLIGQLASRTQILYCLLFKHIAVVRNQVRCDKNN